MDRLSPIVQAIFHTPPHDIVDAMSPATTPTWDSMSFLLFIAELEKEFSISFSVQDVLSVENLGDIKRLLQKKGAVFSKDAPRV